MHCSYSVTLCWFSQHATLLANTKKRQAQQRKAIKATKKRLEVAKAATKSRAKKNADISRQTEAVKEST